MARSRRFTSDPTFISHLLQPALLLLVSIVVRSAAKPPDGQPVDVTETSKQAFTVSLRHATGTIASLVEKGPSSFNFVPEDGHFSVNRTEAGELALGDISLRMRPAGVQQKTVPPLPALQLYPAYTILSSAFGNPEVGVVPLPRGPNDIAVQDITAQLGPPDLPIRVQRRYTWGQDAQGSLKLSFTLHNQDPYNAIDIGALGLPLCFQGRWDGLTLSEMAEQTAFVDFHMGLQHGFATATRMTGRGPMLVMAPLGGTAFEAWRSAREGQAGCGPLWTPEWLVHSKALQASDWEGSEPQFNPPTSHTLAPGGNLTVGVRMFLADSPRHRDAALAQAGYAVARAVPGYTLSTDMTSAQLHITLPKDCETAHSARAQPPDVLSLEGPIGDSRGSMAKSGEITFLVHPRAAGRATVMLCFRSTQGQDRGCLSMHYIVLLPLRRLLQAFGSFQSSVAWLPASSQDPFGRGSAVLPWNRQLSVHVLHDPRAFVVGLSDEAGAGANVGLAIKVRHAPTWQEVARLDEYVQQTLCGTKPGLPHAASLQEPVSGGIRAGLFWVPTPGTAEQGMPGYQYEPSDFSGWIWNRDRSVGSLGRAYNYPHQCVVFWSLYRAAVELGVSEATALPDSPLARQPSWYLKQAARTIQAMHAQALWYTQFGLMVGSVFKDILADLRAAGFAEEADRVDAIMYNRTAVGISFQSSGPCPPNPACRCQSHAATGGSTFFCKAWTENDFPFGSEFAWDSTGQEEIYTWAMHYGFKDTASRALDAVLAFMPSIPHWAYMGSALGIGDFSNNAQLTPYGGWERPLQHYRSGLNAIPVLAAYRQDPGDEHLLRLGIGAITGGLANIDQDGAASMAFHSDPALLRHDPYSGDFGIGLFGHLQLTAAYLLWEGGAWECYLCNLQDPPAPHAGPPLRASSMNSSWATFRVASHVQGRLGCTGSSLWQQACRAAWSWWHAGQAWPKADLQLGDTGGIGALAPVAVWPVDAVRQRMYVEPLGVYLTVQGGTLQQLALDDQGLWRIHAARHEAALPGSELKLLWAHCASNRPAGLGLQPVASHGILIQQTAVC